ncbi:alkaline phosphatase family protein [Zavarzinella formosa]|uniref:alkaline phosphatase family protein n=1 Tax=Zavarzinella formosa TaxID=360055 RepID=UPI00031D3E46|nr:alkaline phosphatase family protein [Zavarzinella formosa]
MKPSLTLACLLLSLGSILADERDTLRVGVQPDGRIVVPTNQILQPAGTQVIFPGRPVDLVQIDGGKTLVAKNMKDLVFIDTATGKVRQTLAMTAPKGAKSGGFSAVGLIAIGDRLIASDTQNSVWVAVKNRDGNFGWEAGHTLKAPVGVKGAAYPTGIARADGEHIWVCSSRGNSVQLICLADGKVINDVSAGVAPYMPLVISSTKLYVSNWGGDRTTDKKDKSSGTPIRTDDRNIANSGTISVVEKIGDGWKQTKTIPVGLHPSGLARNPKTGHIYVANANSDTVSVLDPATDKVLATIDCKPDSKLPFGSGANALTTDKEGKTLYVANGTNNCIAVIDLEAKKLLGLIPTGWYPGAVQLSDDGKKLLVANIKGHGSLAEKRPAAKGHNSHDHLGTVSLIDVPSAAELKKHTETVNANNRLGYALAGLEKPRADVKPMPVPERHGEPSVIEHVFYVIKENRTYDQVFGDMKEGNGDANLCIFGEEVTPNHHKLAREFTLMDNFYCSGILSADGHQWVNEAYVVDYLERQFGGFTRSYPYDGDDPLAYSAGGFIWDNVLARKKTFYNFGEFCETTYEPKGAKWTDVYQDFLNGTSKVKVNVKPSNQSIAALTHPGYAGFPLQMPDVYRAKIFMEQLAKWEKAGTLPHLIYVYLPNDHTSGTSPAWPTPRAMVADNDLAFGQVVEAISKSKFWAKSCILVTEDDPQNGFDHIDGHRTVGLAISPYTKRKAVDSTCYNQTGMVKTIELMLGLPPMNQLDLTATPLRGCFTAKADLTAYTAVKNRIPLDEMNKPLSKLQGQAKIWAKQSLELDFDKEDMADEDTLNRILWFSVRGDKPYPGD